MYNSYLKECLRGQSHLTGLQCCYWRHSYRKNHWLPSQRALGQMESCTDHTLRKVDSRRHEFRIHIKSKDTPTKTGTATESTGKLNSWRRTWSAAVPPVGWGDPATVEKLQWAGRHMQCCSLPDLLLSHSSATQSTRTLSLESDRRRRGQTVESWKRLFWIVAQILTTCCCCRQVRHIF